MLKPNPPIKIIIQIYLFLEIIPKIHSFILSKPQYLRVTTNLVKTALFVRYRGLETAPMPGDAATPQKGGMALYIKAGPDGKSVGDCPFAHYVRMALHEKNLPYDLRPSTQETKPSWLLDYFEGTMPALRHYKDCYVESEKIVQYLDFFFQEPPLGVSEEEMNDVKNVTSSLFPCIAKYLKHDEEEIEEEKVLESNLLSSLENINDYLLKGERSGLHFVGNGEVFTLVDCSLAPKLYHLNVGSKHFKQKDILIQFPALSEYMNSVFHRPSFVESSYPKETVIWGWNNARKN